MRGQVLRSVGAVGVAFGLLVATLLAFGGPEPPAPATGGIGAAAVPPVSPLRVVATLGTGSGPQPAIYDAADGLVYVADRLSGNITVYQGLDLVATLAVPGSPNTGVVDPANGLLYVTQCNSSAVSVIRGTVVLANVTVGPCGGSPAYDPANGFVYVPLRGTGVVAVVNGTQLQGTIALPGAPRILGAAFDPGDGDVYISTLQTNFTYVVQNLSYVGAVATGLEGSTGTYDPSDGLLWVTDGWAGNVSLVDGTGIVSNLSIDGAGFAGAYHLGFADRPTYDSANGLIYVPFTPASGAGGLDIFGDSGIVDQLAIGPLLPGSAGYVPYGNGTGFIYEPTSESLNGGGGAGLLYAIAGGAILGNVSYPSEAVGATYDAADGDVYLPTYVPPNATSPVVRDYVVVVQCPACIGVRLEESGAPAGSNWSVNVSNTTRLYAEAAGGAAGSPLTLHLRNGSYALAVTVPAGTTIQVASGNAEYWAGNGTILVGVVPPSGGGGARTGPAGSPVPVAWLAAGAGAVAVASVAGAVASRRRVRREGEELVARMRAASAIDLEPGELRR